MSDPSVQRLKAVVRGAVQGVGFRPFVHRLAASLGLLGWVKNTGVGVFLEAEGKRGALENFLKRLQTEAPPRASIQSLEFSFLDAKGYGRFEIVESAETGPPTAFILPDIAPCADCLRELFDPHDHRHRHPFINCTNCGPRYTVVEALPYDRPNTTMKRFPMCPACREEYEDPGDRRFHAQPVCCPDCGPHLELWDEGGKVLSLRQDALRDAANAVREGRILALKGVGGYQLVCDARNGEAVRLLRSRKKRDEKPFALMASDLEQARVLCETSFLEERLLSSPEAPIVLMRRKPDAPAAQGVAPGNPCIGVMLPASPIHHLLARELGFPVVATSGNLSDEPQAVDEREALERLHGIADLFLVHDRPIARRVDDSVGRILLGREQILRRARGYAPLPITLNLEAPPVLAVGAHLKNTAAFSRGRDVFVSQHIGDLENETALESFRQIVDSLTGLYGFKPTIVAHDLHPDYASTRTAKAMEIPLVPVQHHLAHALACAAENEVEPPFLAVSWDGTGLGTDGTVWGGEFLRIDEKGWSRAGHLRTFRLPGGDQAAREPRRSAFGILLALMGRKVLETEDLPSLVGWTAENRRVLLQAAEHEVNSPLSSSAGRLFDAVSSLLGIRQRNAFEGQAAMELEFSAWKGVAGSSSGPVRLENTPEGFIFDWEPLILSVLQDVRKGRPVPDIARAFHASLAEGIAEAAKGTGLKKAVLTGGCFQNRLLTEMTVERLKAAGIEPYWHQRIPPNDGGISLGQLVEAERQTQKAKDTV